MRELTDKDFALVNETVMPIVERYALEDTEPGLYNPFLFALTIPVKNGEEKTIKCANEIFHALGVLPKERSLAMAEAGDYCAIFTDEDGATYTLLFNHPVAMAFKSGDEEYEFTIKGRNEIEEAEAEAEEAEMRSLVDGIKIGRLKSKTPDGYLVLAGEFYDAIEAGKKTVEYRDFTEYNIKRTIGLKTVRFNRGYGSKGKPPKQMQWEVKGVVLMDGEENECDPYNVPEDFWPVTISLQLGKRVG